MQRNKIDNFLIFTFLSVYLFTIISLILIYKGLTLNDTLITCWFSLFGGEVVGCVILKSLKIKKGDT